MTIKRKDVEYYCFINDDCENRDHSCYTEYYVYSNSTARLFHKKNEVLCEVSGERKDHILSKNQIIVSEENCAGFSQLDIKDDHRQAYEADLDDKECEIFFKSKEERDSFVETFSNADNAEASLVSWLNENKSKADRIMHSAFCQLVSLYAAEEYDSFPSFCCNEKENLLNRRLDFSKKLIDYVEHFHPGIFKKIFEKLFEL